MSTTNPALLSERHTKNNSKIGQQIAGAFVWSLGEFLNHFRYKIYCKIASQCKIIFNLIFNRFCYKIVKLALGKKNR